MIDSVFLHEFKQGAGVRLDKDNILFRKPLELYNLSNDITISFNSIDDVMCYILNGKTIKEIIADATIDIFNLQLDGGRGASGGKPFKMGHAGSGAGADATVADLPARMNTRVKFNDKSPERALEEFRKLHALDKKESAVTVDENGYITQYVHGDETSVAITGKKGEMVYHNHPSSSAFSDMDLISTSLSKEKGVVASGKNGDYIFQKTGHFKANNFVKAIKNTTMYGKDYNDAVDKWLSKNQKKYGYKYVFKKA